MVTFSSPLAMALVPRAPPPRMGQTEEAARAAWLRKLDVPSRGASSLPEQAYGRVVPTPDARRRAESQGGWLDEDDAKAAWLASLDDEPSWINRSEIAALADECYESVLYESGDATACEMLSNEEQAKAEWLGRIEEDAKACWLTSLDAEPSWTRGNRNARQVSSVEAYKAELRREIAELAMVNKQILSFYWREGVVNGE